MRNSFFPKEIYRRILFIVTVMLLLMLDTSYALSKMAPPPKCPIGFDWIEGEINEHLLEDLGPSFSLGKCVEETVKDSIVKVNNDSLQSFLDFGKNYKIPYIGEKVKIKGIEYSVLELFNQIDKVWINITQALQIKRISGSKIQFNLSEVNKIVKSLKNKDNLFSAINLTFAKRWGSKGEPIKVELFKKHDEYYTFNIDGLSTEIEFVLKSGFQNVHFESLTKKSKINSSLLFDLTFKWKKDGFDLTTKFKSWTIKAPGISGKNTRSLPYEPYYVNGDQLEIYITPERVSTNADYFFKIHSDAIKSLDKVSIPFFEKIQFAKDGKRLSTIEIFNMIKTFHVYMQLALDYGLKLDKSGNGGYININEIKNVFDKFPKKKFPPGSIAMLNGSLVEISDRYDNLHFYDVMGKEDLSKIKEAKLHDKHNVVLYKVTIDSLQLDKNVDANLMETNDLNVSLDVYIGLGFRISNSSFFMNSYFIDQIVLTITSDVKELNIQPYKIQMEDENSKNYGKLRYSVSIVTETSWYDSIKIFNPSMVIDYEPSSLKINDSITIPLEGENKINQIVYDFNRNEWKLPEILKTIAIEKAH